MSSKMILAGILSIIAALTVMVTEANAGSVTFTGTSGIRSASVSFVDMGTTLTVTLTNTSVSDASLGSHILTAVFFDVVGSGPLTRVSAVLNAGSTVLLDPDGQPVGGVVGGEWAYKSGLSGTPLGATEGISSAAFGSLFAAGDRFSGLNLHGNANGNLGGINYGITSAGDLAHTVVGASVPLIKNSVVFTLSGFLAGSTFSNVSFQYGNSNGLPLPSGNNVLGNPVPEPSSLLLAGVGMAFALRCRGRRK